MQEYLSGDSEAPSEALHELGRGCKASKKELNPMALGVLNNLSAIYAENNLNNTSNSLQNVLRQLSSGSRINSGADDAAGLSLVNGLAANTSALTQSKTNATEGVGLLQVADGALSQVTSLLNRAITLATEASNGTLNSTQEGAANQEYQSILAEINNIGSTTTYNQQAVFSGNTIAIYSGDSSTTGSSIDNLNIRTLSESSVGDTGGAMSYNSGQSSVFLNLSTSSTNAQSTDTLNANGTSTIDVNYLVKGSNGTSSPATTSITVGTGYSQPNTAQGLINAINDAGLGLSATFATAAQSGFSSGGSQTGIQISGGLISVGVDPSTASTSATLNPSEITTGNLTLGQTITVAVGSTTVASVQIDQSNDTLAGLASAINTAIANGGSSSPSSLVTANVIYNSANTPTSIQLTDSTDTGGPLTVNVTGGNVVPNSLSSTLATNTPVAVQFNSSGPGSVGSPGTATLSVSGVGSNASSQALSGSITLSNGSTQVTYQTSTSAVSNSFSGGVVTLSAANSTLSGLAQAMSAAASAGGLGVTAAVAADGSGIQMTSSTNGTAINAVGSSTLKALLAENVTNVPGGAGGPGTDGSTILSMTGDSQGFQGTDPLTGTLVLQNSTGAAYTFTMASGAENINAGAHTVSTAAQTVNSLVQAINDSTVNTGIGATLNADGTITLNANVVNSTVTATSNLVDSEAVNPSVATANPTNNQNSTATILAGIGEGAFGGLTQAGDALSGSITISNGLGVTKTFVMNSNAANAGNTINLSAANSTLTGLMQAINTTGSALGINATLDNAPGQTTSGLLLTANAPGNTITAGAGLSQTSALAVTTGTLGSNPQVETALLSLEDGGNFATVNGGAADGVFSGSFTITSNVGGSSIKTDTIQIGAALSGHTGTITTGGSKLSDIVAAINNSTDLDVSASIDPTTGGIVLQALSNTDTGLTANMAGLTDTLAETGTTVLPGTIQSNATLTLSNTSGVNGSGDLLTQGTHITLQNTATGAATTFVMGGVGGGANQVNVGTNGSPSTLTMQALASAIQNAGIDLTAIASGSGITITSTSAAGQILVTANNLTDNAGLTTKTTTPGTGPTSATKATVSMNTTAGMNIAGTDALAGQLILTNSSNGTAVTFNLNNSGASNGNTVNLNTANSTVFGLMQAINNNNTLGMVASINATTGALQMQSNATNTNITVGGTGVTDATSVGFSGGAATAGTASVKATNTISLAGGNTLTLGHQLGGSITISANNVVKTFVMGGTAGVSGNTITLGQGTSTVQDLETAILGAGLGVGVSQNGSGNLVLTSNTANNSAITITNNATPLTDAMGFAAARATLGSYASATDQVSGTLDFSVGGTEYNLGSVTGKTVQQLVNKINSGSYTDSTDNTGQYGVTASLVQGVGGFETLTLTSNTYGTGGNITNGSTTGTSLSDEGVTAAISYVSGSAYHVGISNVAGTGVYDSSISTETAPTGVTAPYARLTANTGGTSGIATMSYSDGAGQSLSATDLLNQADAESAVTALNMAITDVAAQDGYIGAEINTLNSISQVMSTQQENVVSAQNALQATDYASATSNMSKYEILSQTGIAALAQANSVQQEVTKLLQ